MNMATIKLTLGCIITGMHNRYYIALTVLTAYKAIDIRLNYNASRNLSSSWPKPISFVPIPCVVILQVLQERLEQQQTKPVWSNPVIW